MLKQIHKYWAFIFIIVFLFGCTSKQQNKTDTSLVLLQPSSYNGQLTAQQLMTVEYEQQHKKLRMILEITESQISVVGLSGFSVPLFNVTWDGVELISRSNVPEKYNVISGEKVLEDVMLALWPKKELTPLLVHKGLVLVASESNRQFYSDGRLVMTIEYQNFQQKNGCMLVQYYDVDATYKLETLQWEARNE